ncbi:hypothetical protein CEXT_624261 [Caerostris extrusa]|uniref:Uncharacterized protein n=1 Tax=Caerostris extrusa TaxID=172846 RepID=A0AAV4WTG5_CAEEX|nr:hypothetical protein CEXT_624261 [Caerostris extrusa]
MIELLKMSRNISGRETMAGNDSSIHCLPAQNPSSDSNCRIILFSNCCIKCGILNIVNKKEHKEESSANKEDSIQLLFLHWLRSYENIFARFLKKKRTWEKENVEKYSEKILLLRIFASKSSCRDSSQECRILSSTSGGEKLFRKLSALEIQFPFTDSASSTGTKKNIKKNLLQTRKTVYNCFSYTAFDHAKTFFTILRKKNMGERECRKVFRVNSSVEYICFYIFFSGMQDIILDEWRGKALSSFLHYKFSFNLLTSACSTKNKKNIKKNLLQTRKTVYNCFSYAGFDHTKIFLHYSKRKRTWERECRKVFRVNSSAEDICFYILFSGSLSEMQDIIFEAIFEGSFVRSQSGGEKLFRKLSALQIQFQFTDSRVFYRNKKELKEESSANKEDSIQLLFLHWLRSYENIFHDSKKKRTWEEENVEKYSE